MTSATLPMEQFDLVCPTRVLLSEKPNKALSCALAPNEHQMNRVTAFLPNGKAVVIGQRPGSRGVDFNKIVGGKVYAVAADSVTPVWEKPPADAPVVAPGGSVAARVQKLENGIPLYSSNGFYTLSTKDYPALRIDEGFTRLFNDGEKVMFIGREQWQSRQRFVLEMDLDWDILLSAIRAAIDDSNNFVSKFDGDTNKKRKRAIEDRIRTAEDESEEYVGVPFQPLVTSEKDGNPFVLYGFEAEGVPLRNNVVMREREGLNDADRPITVYEDADAALEAFIASPDGQLVQELLAAGKVVRFGFSCGNVMRTSVTFRRKCENFIRTGGGKTPYGDDVYIHGALGKWVKGIMSVIHSMHPNFPSKDYGVLHYVAACRQMEIGMNRLPGDKKAFGPPVALVYNLDSLLT